MVMQISFHKTESNRYYSGGHYRQDTSRPDNEVIFSHLTLSEPLCGWEWYKAHYKTELPEQSIEVYFDDKRLATVSMDMKNNKGIFKAIVDAEIAKHQDIYYKHKGKWNWLYIPQQTEQIPPIIPEVVNPIVAQATAIIEDMTYADMMVCVG